MMQVLGEQIVQFNPSVSLRGKEAYFADTIKIVEGYGILPTPLLPRLLDLHPEVPPPSPFRILIAEACPLCYSRLAVGRGRERAVGWALEHLP
jgi:hypothetical protein